jgi:hypothetical protein
MVLVSVSSEGSREYPDTDITTGWSTSSGTTHWNLIDEDISAPNTSDYIYTTSANTIDEWDFNICPSDVQNVTQIQVRLHIMKDAGRRTLSADVDWRIGAGTYNSSQNTGSFPTTNNTVTLTWGSLNLSKAECDDIRVRVDTVQEVGGGAANHYIYTANLDIEYTATDTTPPYYQFDQDNSSGSVEVGEIVGTSSYWDDAQSDLDTAILRTNETGVWENRSFYGFGSKPEYSNFTIDTTSQFGETICWVQWANDTSGNLNDSMGVGEHCFDVKDSTPPYYQFDQDNSSGSVEVGEIVGVSSYWDDNVQELLWVWWESWVFEFHYRHFGSCEPDFMLGPVG